jgi:hypothetical protein
MKNIEQNEVKEMGLSILKFLQDRLLEKNETIENSTGGDFSSGVWGENFDFRPTKNGFTFTSRYAAGDLKEFLSKKALIDLYETSEPQIISKHEIISRALKWSILYEYIRAVFTEDSQKIFLTEKGLDKVNFFK